MANPYYVEALQLLGGKLDTAIKQNDFVEKPLKCVVLGGYALQALCDKYGVKIERKTNDIDIFTPDAKVLIGDGVKLTPTGAQMPLTDGFHAELFDWISGMDGQKDLELRIFAAMGEDQKPVATIGSVAFYLPSPEVFVANKLFSYKSDNSRTKDLRDVAKLIKILIAKDMPALKKAEELISQYDLADTYRLAINQYGMV
ncbi:MAG: hypothetical protein AABX75_00570 [Nanoarchaeota archaeon]